MVTYPYVYIVSPLADLGGGNIVAAAHLQLVAFVVEAANNEQIVCINTARGKDHSQKNLSKPILL